MRAELDPVPAVSDVLSERTLDDGRTRSDSLRQTCGRSDGCVDLPQRAGYLRDE